MSFFSDLRAERLIAEIRGVGDPLHPDAQKAFQKLAKLGAGAIPKIRDALAVADKNESAAYLDILTQLVDNKTFPLLVQGLVDGQVLTVVLQLTGGTVQVTGIPTCAPTAQTEFSGQLESISSTQLVVSGRTVDVTQLQKVWKPSGRAQLSDLKVGDRINDHHLTLAEKRAARAREEKKGLRP